MASSSHTFLDHAEKTDPSYLEEDVGVADEIFLSHSGAQKLFVEFLYNALRRANQTAFFDRHSLPKAAPFPFHINRAARGCKLGVLVLSNEYFTSKWSMLELDIMVDQKVNLCPLFYRLSPKDLDCPEKLSEWQSAWKEWVDEDQAKRWAETVKMLRSINGVVFQKGGSEFDYIEKVVTAICAFTRSHALYDLSSIEGHRHLAQEVNKHFSSLVEDARGCKRACMVGLYGVGGLGKTTLCKTMVNLYTSPYLGRSCLIQFPSNGDEGEIVRVCKLALKKLDNVSDQVLEINGSFDEVIRLMKDHVTKYDVFLAIDNVSQKSEAAAERLLGVGFTVDSKILLTSRSQQVLQKVLSYHMKNSYICSLPTPNYEDSLKIFQKSLNRADFTSLRIQKQVETFVERFRYDGTYHPLALKALASHLCMLWNHGDSEAHSHDLACILAEIDTPALQSLDNAVRLNYDELSQHEKQMFLDIALWIPQKSIGFYHKRTVANAVQWLHLLFEGFRKSQIRQCIRELDVAGVIEIEIDKHGDEMIRVDDLYFDLAQREATSTGFLASAEGAMEGMMCERLERLFLEGVTGDQCMKKLQQPKCPRLFQLHFLCAADIEIWRKIHLPALRVLILNRPRRVHSRIWFNVLRGFDKLNLKCFIQLKFLSLQRCDFVNSLETLSALCNLQMLHIYGCLRLQNLDGLGCLTKLEALKVKNCGALKKLPDLGGVTGFERLTLCQNHLLEEVSGRFCPALKKLLVGQCGALKKLPDLGGVTGLERLKLFHNDSLEKVSGSLSPGFKDLTVEWCGALKKLPNLGGVTGLERLTLCGNGSLEEVSGCLSPAVKDVIVGCSGAMKKLPDLGGATGLERLGLCDNCSVEEVSGRLSPALKVVTVEMCGALKKLPDLGAVTGLERLKLFGNHSLEELSGQLSPALKVVTVEMCEALKKLPDLGGVTGLERLELYQNDSLEEVSGGLSPALKEVIVGHCGAFKELPDLGGVTGLERLKLCDNRSLRLVSGRLSPGLKDVTVEWCGALKKLPDLGGVAGLERLTLSWNGSLEEVSGRLGPALKVVVVEMCGALKKLPDLGDATGLERLELLDNDSLEEVSGRLGPALKELYVARCGALKQLPDLGGVIGLERLELCENDSLEEVSGRRSPVLKEVIVVRCRALKKLLDFGGMAGSERLTLYGKNSVEVVGLGSLSSAPKKQVLIYECPLLTRSNVLELNGNGWTGKEWEKAFQCYRLGLQHLRIEECSTVTETDVGILMDLRCLEVRKCGQLKAIRGLDALWKLEEVVVNECGRLEDEDGGVSALRRRSNLALAIDCCPCLS